MTTPDHRGGPPGLTRGQLLRRATALGLGAPTLAGLLAACGAGEEAAGGGGQQAASARSLSAPAKLAGEVNFLNWAEWIGPGTVKRFRTKYDVRVRQSFFTNNEEALAKIRANRGGYDVALPGTNAVEILRATNGLERLNPDWIPNTRTITERFRRTKADPGGEFAVANDWSFHGVGLREDRVREEVRGWEDLWRLKERYSRKITVLDDQRDVIGATLRMLGHSYNSTSATELKQAQDMLLQLKPHLLAITSTNQRELLLSGDAVLTMDWNQSLAGANRERDTAQFVIPREGTGFYADYLVIPAGARHLYDAHVFINFLHEPATYEDFVEYTSTPWTNGSVTPRLPRWMRTSEWLNPPDSAKLEYQVDVGDATPLYADVWRRFKSA